MEIDAPEREDLHGVNDRAATVVTGGRTKASQELTADRLLLLAALDR